MKKLLISFIVFLYSCCIIFSQDKVSKYLFPMYPGDKEWKETKYPERIKALDIPDSILNKISNSQLIGACFEYPFNVNLFAFNNFDEGFANLCKTFNGYSELLKRKNIEDDLIDFYDEMLAFKFKDKYSLYDESQDPLNFYLIEKILSQDKIIDNLSSLQKRRLFLISKEKYIMKKGGKDIDNGHPVFSTNSLQSTMVLISKLALKEDQLTDQTTIQKCKGIIMSRKTSIIMYESIIETLEKIYK